MARDWTLRETIAVREFAGTVPLSRLAHDLSRDVRDVASEAGRLGVPFVYVGTPLFWCDECASWRVKLTPSGICPFCSKRRNLIRIEERISDLLAQLPMEQREVYADTEAERGTRRRDPAPSMPDTCQMDNRAAVVAMSRYYADYDRWETKETHRIMRAAQKRKERIQRKVMAQAPETRRTAPFQKRAAARIADVSGPRRRANHKRRYRIVQNGTGHQKR